MCVAADPCNDLSSRKRAWMPESTSLLQVASTFGMPGVHTWHSTVKPLQETHTVHILVWSVDQFLWLLMDLCDSMLEGNLLLPVYAYPAYNWMHAKSRIGASKCMSHLRLAPQLSATHHDTTSASLLGSQARARCAASARLSATPALTSVAALFEISISKYMF